MNSTFSGKIEIGNLGNVGRKAYPVLVNNAFGRQTLCLTIPVEEFIARSIVPNQAGISLGADFGDTPSQRPINPAHAQGLALYMLKAELASVRVSPGPVSDALRSIREEVGVESYYGVSPIVANLQPRKEAKIDLKDGSPHLFVDDIEIFRVIDGQHRREGRDIMLKWLKSVIETGRYPVGRRTGTALFVPANGRVDVLPEERQIWGEVHRNSLRSGFEISLHLELGSEEERQLFFVLNNLGRSVESSLAFDFDESNPVNQYIKNVLIGELKLKVVPKDVASRDEGEMALKDLVAVNAILFLNKTNVRSATPPMVGGRASVATDFWRKVAQIPGYGQRAARATTVAAQPVVLKALAKLVHDFAFAQDDEEHLDILLESIPELNLHHGNPIWRCYDYQPAEREERFPGISAYLPPEGTGNRDIGGYDSSTELMHFGAKHNDIFPIIGDLVRYELKLPPRQHRGRTETETQVPSA
ncbi:DNA sulfur modification protein DndB [Rhizobium leguminosarum]